MYGLKERAMQDSLRRFKADIFQALAHPTRLAIIENLEQGELSAGELQEKLSVEQANLSQHLAVLRTKQLVVNRKAGNQVFYSVRDPIILKVLALMRTLRASLRSSPIVVLAAPAIENSLPTWRGLCGGSEEPHTAASL